MCRVTSSYVKLVAKKRVDRRGSERNEYASLRIDNGVITVPPGAKAAQIRRVVVGTAAATDTVDRTSQNERDERMSTLMERYLMQRALIGTSLHVTRAPFTTTFHLLPAPFRRRTGRSIGGSGNARSTFTKLARNFLVRFERGLPDSTRDRLDHLPCRLIAASALRFADQIVVCLHEKTIDIYWHRSLAQLQTATLDKPAPYHARLILISPTIGLPMRSEKRGTLLGRAAAGSAPG
jgi:hypothetical protein